MTHDGTSTGGPDSPPATRISPLEQIALQMRALLDADSQPTYVQRNLFGGVSILLQRKRDGSLRLAVARTDRPPEAEEVTAIGAAFRLPPVVWEWSTKEKMAGVYVGRGKHAGWRQKVTTYRVAECTWREVSQ